MNADFAICKVCDGEGPNNWDTCPLCGGEIEEYHPLGTLQRIPKRGWDGDGADTVTHPMRVYTRASLPFRMGGDCHPYISTDALAGSPIALSLGVSVRCVTATDGRRFYVESQHGSLHGTSLADIRADLEGAAPEGIASLMERSAFNLARAERWEPAEFWKLVKK